MSDASDQAPGDATVVRPVFPAPPPRRPVGGPSSFSLDTADTILRLIRDGWTRDQFDKSDTMPCYSTIQDWCARHPEFASRYAQARYKSARAFEEEAIRVSRTAKDRDSAASARVVVDTLKWAARVRNPKDYGASPDTVINNINVEVVEKRRATKGRILENLKQLARPEPMTIEHEKPPEQQVPKRR